MDEVALMKGGSLLLLRHQNSKRCHPEPFSTLSNAQGVIQPGAFPTDVCSVTNEILNFH